MKKILITLVMGYKIIAFGQEKNIFNIQIGFAGAWINNEIKIKDKFVLHAEIGMEPSWSVGNGTVWHNNFRLEPRYYYNINKRENQGKNISKNSANFFGIACNYRPGYVIFSNNKILGNIESFSFVPKWGIKRMINKNFSYEAGAGLGYRNEPGYGNY